VQPKLASHSSVGQSWQMKISLPAVFEGDFRRLRPGRGCSRDALEVLLARMAIDVPMQDLRPVHQIRQHHRRDLAIVTQTLPPVPESGRTPAAEIALTRKEKEEVLRQMYSLPHWIAVVRLFAHKAMHMDEARKHIKPLADEFGKEPMANACEILVEIFTEGKEPFARLKSHIRRMAHQIIGPAPTLAAPAITPAPDAEAEPEPPRPSEKKRRTRTAASAPSPAAVKTDPAPSGRSTIMEQYQAAKEKHPDMLLLFRMGDFYELFGEDAETAHRLLGLTLTTRDRTLAMAGFPYHQLETYLHKLLKEGQRVAVCEPVEESLARGPIQREVTRVVTPGTGSDVPHSEGREVKQPRHFVLKKFEEWMNQEGHAFVAIDDVKKTTPDVAKHVAGLDFIVLRGEEKLLVTVRPNLPAKNANAAKEVQKVFGAPYRSVRIWPSEAGGEWKWDEHPIAAAAEDGEFVEEPA
jgi:hypothetical protein